MYAYKDQIHQNFFLAKYFPHVGKWLYINYQLDALIIIYS